MAERTVVDGTMMDGTMTAELLLAAVLVVALVMYVLSGGADFGGGVWELFATGPRADKQRRAIEAAIAPIWEANHVWLILAVVVLFSGFPAAFAAISTALHVPIVLLLIGIVLRGAAFVFRSYDIGPGHRERSRKWSLVFAVSSLLTPVMIGVCAAAVVSGDLRIDPQTERVQTDFISAWWGSFPFAVGVFFATLCSYLAATYLCVEHQGAAIADDFRHRALLSGVALGLLAPLCLLLSRDQAPAIFEGLLNSPWALGLHALTGVCAVAALFCLWRRRFRLARLFAAAQATLIVLGWALSQFPFVVVPDLTISAAAAPRNVVVAMLWILAIGSVPLLLAFRYLYAVFKPVRPR
jgi:cytochrome bd ubiquinol oxidase subunit II